MWAPGPASELKYGQGLKEEYGSREEGYGSGCRYRKGTVVSALEKVKRELNLDLECSVGLDIK